MDKTLQDIVYKLVPELFIKEMQRRQRFYQDHPDLMAKCTPEERGEDTERTIFNPKDLISLSIEYVRWVSFSFIFLLRFYVFHLISRLRAEARARGTSRGGSE